MTPLKRKFPVVRRPITDRPGTATREESELLRGGGVGGD